jgi:rod shape-determining protein MreC
MLKGMPVVAANGLVGRLEQVSRHQSSVLILTDPAFDVGVRLSPSGSVGVATGQGAGKAMAIDLVDVGTAVDPGSVVVTSGLQQSPYPPGIPVGKITAVVSKPGGVRQYVSMNPLIDAGRLTFVKVLLWSPR